MNTAVAPEPPAISAEEFDRFRSFFYRKTGIYFDASKRYFVDKRLQDRTAARRCATFQSYFNLLKAEQGRELQELINLMTVNETYFFRESYQLDCLVRDMLDTVTAYKRPGERIRIWSMPCASGEEPYSIAMALLDNWPGLAHWDVEILASDIDTRAMEAAREAVYDKRSVHSMPESRLRRYFTPSSKDGVTQYRLKPEVREAVGFYRVNLNSPKDVMSIGPIDIVFCRNLLIYFDELSRRQAVERLYNIINPGGFICLGHSESMSRISPLFRARKFPDALVYQK